jgi:hypothetical protein
MISGNDLDALHPSDFLRRATIHVYVVNDSALIILIS